MKSLRKELSGTVAGSLPSIVGQSPETAKIKQFLLDDDKDMTSGPALHHGECAMLWLSSLLESNMCPV